MVLRRFSRNQAFSCMLYLVQRGIRYDYDDVCIGYDQHPHPGLTSSMFKKEKSSMLNCEVGISQQC